MTPFEKDLAAESGTAMLERMLRHITGLGILTELGGPYPDQEVEPQPVSEVYCGPVPFEETCSTLGCWCTSFAHLHPAP